MYGKLAFVGICSFSFEKDLNPAGLSRCTWHHKLKFAHAASSLLSIALLLPGVSKCPSLQSKTMVEPMKFLAIPNRNMWNISRLNHIEALPVSQRSKASAVNGGGLSHGTSQLTVRFHWAPAVKSSKGHAADPAKHSEQHGIEFTWPTFW